jgi:hypothetical protein
MPIFRRHYTNADLVAIVCGCRCGLVLDCGKSSYILSPTQSTTAHNNHQVCIRVVPPEDGQVMPETCRDFEP